MRRVSLRNSLLLLLTAFIWGTAFVAQSVGMDYVEPFTFNAARSLIGGVVLIPVVLIRSRLKSPEQRAGESRRTTVIGGICCGVLLCVASCLQQFGIKYTTVGKAGFITALYIVIVPLLSIFLRRKPGWKIWVSVALSLAGLYLLCMTEQLALSGGDTMVFLCAVSFSLHILVIDYFSPRVDGVLMSCIQFFVSGLLSSLCMFLFEEPSVQSLCTAWLPVLYAGVLSSGVGYTLQIVGQKDMNPTVASLILSLESVISALSAWVLLGQDMTVREVSGCVLMFSAIILAQLPQRSKTKQQQ